MKRTRRQLLVSIFKSIPIAGVLTIWLIAPARATAAEPIVPEQFNKLHTLIKPKKAERAWEQLPWMTDLWEARKRAAAAGKPVLLWMRDGHPLGCV